MKRKLTQLSPSLHLSLSLSVCLGRLTDAMWLESLALIAPFVQQEFQLSDSEISYCVTSVLAGMMVGAAVSYV